MLGESLLEFLVLDTGPLIKNMKFDKLATDVLTTKNVMNEVKDVHTRQRLELQPIEVKIREPSSSSIQFVTDFAKLTGDIRSLSTTDIEVVALTYEMERRVNGTDHLRKNPVNCIRVNEGFGDDKITNLAGFYVPKSFNTKSTSRTTSVSSNIVGEELGITETPGKFGETSTPFHENIAEAVASDSIHSIETTSQNPPDQTRKQGLPGETTAQDLAESLDSCQLDEGWSTVPVKPKKTILGNDIDDFCEMDIPDDVLISDSVDCEEDYDISDNEEDWITPANITEHQTNELALVRVACATTDFAMQNVLLQIGLSVISVDGVLIKYAKTYVLKCTACFTVVRDCTKVFCTRCGNKTLEKVAVTVDEEGITWYQRLSKKPKTGRGVRYSLPKPKGGRGSDMPWVTEDQPDKQRRSKLQCNVKSSVDVMSSDYVKSASPFGVTNVDSRAFRHFQSGGRHGNPNERKKRTGNRKKKKI